MHYTIIFDLYIDDDKILSEEEIKDVVGELINEGVNNIRLIDVND